MQSLSSLDNVDVLVELVLLPLVVQTTEISSEVDRRSVFDVSRVQARMLPLTSFSDDSLVHLEFDEIDQQRPSVLTGELLLLANVDSALHRFWLDLRFTPVDIEVNVELLVCFLQLLNG